jgi:hypothetical protein
MPVNEKGFFDACAAVLTAVLFCVDTKVFYKRERKRKFYKVMLDLHFDREN